jgi:hypothetical protein
LTSFDEGEPVRNVKVNLPENLEFESLLIIA